MEDIQTTITRPKSKTMSLIERRSSHKPQLSQLQLISKHINFNSQCAKPSQSLKEMAAMLVQPYEDCEMQSRQIENNNLEINDEQFQNKNGLNGCFQLVKEIHERDHVFSPLRVATKTTVKSDTVRSRLNTGEYLSANDNYSYTRYNEDNTQRIVKPQHGIFQRYYKLGKKIGEGAHSVVRDCSRKAQPESSPHILPQSDKQLVVKIMKYRDTEILFQLLEEEKIMNEFRNHPNLVKKTDFLIEKQKKTAYLVMEKAKGYNLTEILKQKTKLSEFESKLILKQVIQAVDYLHKKNICHRDITNNNIIYDSKSKRVKIIDFSVSKQLHKPSQMLWTNTGSVGFMAPEIFTECNYDKNVDMWSVGVVAHSILTGYLPFYETWENQQQLIQAIIQGKLYLETIGSHLSPECLDFLLKCLEKDPKKRIKSSEALNHPWINKIEVQQLSQTTQNSYHRKSLVVTSMTDIDEDDIANRYQKTNNDFECIYINRLNQEFKHLRAVNC